MPSTSPTPQVASCPPTLTCRQPRPRAGSPSAAAWLPAWRRAGWLPPPCPDLLPSSPSPTADTPPPALQPLPARGRIHGLSHRGNGPSSRAASAQPPRQSAEEEEQAKEMINFLFLLKLSNRISGFPGQACQESSWQGGNPRKRGPYGSAAGHRGSIGPRAPFEGARLPPRWVGSPAWRGHSLQSGVGRGMLPDLVWGYPSWMSLFPPKKCRLGDRKAGFGLVCISCARGACAGDGSITHSGRC